MISFHFCMSWIPACAGMIGEGMAFYVYIVASGKNGTLYIGMTDDLEKRIWEHKQKIFKGFTAKYGVDQLVWYEMHAAHPARHARRRFCKRTCNEKMESPVENSSH